MRSIVLLSLVVAAASYTGSCSVSAPTCAPGCDCHCSATCTYPPTHAPTSAPTGTPGRCCGTRESGENFCIITDQNECEGGARRLAPANFVDTLKTRRSLGGEFTPGEFCNVSDPCDTGVPVTSGGANFSVDVSMAGLGATGGISLTPVANDDLPDGSEAELPGEVILAFEVTRYEGSDVVPSGFLTPPHFIVVKIQATDPEITDAASVEVLRWDEDEGKWFNVQEECAGKIQSTDFTLDESTDPNTLEVPLCHTSTFVLTGATDSKDKKDKKSKGKKEKVPSVGKPGKDAKDGKKEAGKKEAGKAGKKVGIAVGAAVGGVAVVSGVALVVLKCRAKKTKRTNKKANKARDVAEVSTPVGMSV